MHLAEPVLAGLGAPLDVLIFDPFARHLTHGENYPEGPEFSFAAARHRMTLP